jgi:predicted esterase
VVRRLALPAALVTILAALPLTAGAAKHHPPRPDLKVSTGTVTLKNGQLIGSFVLRNAGQRDAGDFTVSLRARVRGGRRSILIKRFTLKALDSSDTKRLNVSLALPGALTSGQYNLRVCADTGGDVKERKEANNCRTVGQLLGGSTPSPRPVGNPLAPITPGGPSSSANSTSGQPGTTPGGPSCPPSPPSSQVPTNPVSFSKEQTFTLNSCKGVYWINVPDAYNTNHQTPMTLFIWLHGCGGNSSDDINNAADGSYAPNDRDWIAVAPGGREGGCWDPGPDQDIVLATLADVESHFNVNRHRVILGGYSSGGDLGYRTIFYHSLLFAGILAENTTPFRDTGSSQQDSINAAAWKFNVVHLAHKSDEAYPLATVQSETDAMKAAGFPLVRIELEGNHYDADTHNSGTEYDMRSYLLPHLQDGWTSP